MVILPIPWTFQRKSTSSGVVKFSDTFPDFY
jgi:hypothetical protein